VQKWHPANWDHRCRKWQMGTKRTEILSDKLLAAFANYEQKSSIPPIFNLSKFRFALYQYCLVLCAKGLLHIFLGWSLAFYDTFCVQNEGKFEHTKGPPPYQLAKGPLQVQLSCKSTHQCHLVPTSHKIRPLLSKKSLPDLRFQDLWLSKLH
jgi:hypothetical protein